eukprot:3128198-Rhodomonas_salina.2
MATASDISTAVHTSSSSAALRGASNCHDTHASVSPLGRFRVAELRDKLLREISRARGSAARSEAGGQHEMAREAQSAVIGRPRVRKIAAEVDAAGANKLRMERLRESKHTQIDRQLNERVHHPEHSKRDTEGANSETKEWAEVLAAGGCVDLVQYVAALSDLGLIPDELDVDEAIQVSPLPASIVCCA